MTQTNSRTVTVDNCENAELHIVWNYYLKSLFHWASLNVVTGLPCHSCLRGMQPNPRFLLSRLSLQMKVSSNDHPTWQRMTNFTSSYKTAFLSFSPRLLLNLSFLNPQQQEVSLWPLFLFHDFSCLKAAEHNQHWNRRGIHWSSTLWWILKFLHSVWNAVASLLCFSLDAEKAGNCGFLKKVWHATYEITTGLLN